MRRYFIFAYGTRTMIGGVYAPTLFDAQRTAVSEFGDMAVAYTWDQVYGCGPDHNRL